MNISLSPNEINTIAEQIIARILPQVDAAMQRASKSSRPSLVQLTIEDVAGQLQLSTKTIQKYIKENRLRASNLGTHEKPVWRMSQEEVVRFLAA